MIFLLVGVVTGAEMPCAISVNGNDTGQCGQATPCRTINYALAVGCTEILLQSGVYMITQVCISLSRICYRFSASKCDQVLCALWRSRRGAASGALRGRRSFGILCALFCYIAHEFHSSVCSLLSMSALALVAPDIMRRAQA